MNRVVCHGRSGRSGNRCNGRHRLRNTREVEIYRRGNEVVLREKAQSLSRLLEDLPPWPDDFVEPSDAPTKEREVP